MNRRPREVEDGIDADQRLTHQVRLGKITADKLHAFRDSVVATLIKIENGHTPIAPEQPIYEV
jgi:hypothetical protein